MIDRLWVWLQGLSGPGPSWQVPLSREGFVPVERVLSTAPEVYQGRWAGWAVTASVDPARPPELRLVVHAVFPGLSARLLPYTGALSPPHERPTGDRAFDQRVGVVAPDLFHQLRQLHAPARAALLEVLNEGWSLSGGDLKLELIRDPYEQHPLVRVRSQLHALRAAVDRGPGSAGAQLRTDPAHPARYELARALAERRELGGAVDVPRVDARDLATNLVLALLRGDPGPLSAAPPRAHARVVADLGELALRVTRASGDLAGLVRIATTADDRSALRALEVLGEVGRVEDVAALRPLADRRVLGGERARAAAAAIDRIRARLVGAEAGQIALAEPTPEAGAVTVLGGGELALAQGGEVGEGSAQPARRPTG